MCFLPAIGAVKAITSPHSHRTEPGKSLIVELLYMCTESLWRMQGRKTWWKGQTNEADAISRNIRDVLYDQKEVPDSQRHGMKWDFFFFQSAGIDVVNGAE